MSKTSILLAVLLVNFAALSQPYTTYFTGSSMDVIASPEGGVCLMGGATEDDEAMKWFLNRADGGDVLVLRTSGSDGYNDYMYSQLGITLNSVETIVFNGTFAVNDAYIHQKIKQAEAIWFAGGDQWNYISFWRDSPIDSLINKGIENRDVVVGGISAGMAILGNPYFSAQNGTVISGTALSNPYDSDVTVDNTPFLDAPFMENVITDTHYDDPDRKGRHMVFLARMVKDNGLIAKGIACDEYTAVCIDENGLARIYGEFPSSNDNAYFLQVNCELADPTPEKCQSGLALDWNHGGAAVKVYAVKGNQTGQNTFDLSDWQTGNGGLWKHWYIDNGVLQEINGSAPSCSVSLDEDEDEKFLVFPNPGRDIINISFTNLEPHIIEIYSADGRLQISTEAKQKEITISTERLHKGSYIIRAISEQGNQSVSWVK